MNKIKVLLMIFFLIFVCKVNAQDTLIINNNYKWKIGGKLILERSNDYSQSYQNSDVVSGGLQLIYNLETKLSQLESGVYLIQKANTYYSSANIGSQVLFLVPVKYNFLSIPLLYRVETRYIYFCGGITFDYLLKTSTQNDFYFHLIPFYGNDRIFQMQAGIQVGFEKYLSNQSSIFFEGRLYNNISSSKIEDDFFRRSFTNYGIGTGLNFKLLK